MNNQTIAETCTKNDVARRNLAENPNPRIRYYWTVVAELNAARAGQASGPDMLDIVNELACAAEDMFECRIDPETDALISCCREADTFLARLTDYAEDVRASNGHVSRQFLRFVDTPPVGAPRHRAA